MSNVRVADLAVSLIPAILMSDPRLLHTPTHLAGLAVRLAEQLDGQVCNLTDTTESGLRRTIDRQQRTIQEQASTIRSLKKTLRSST